MVLIEHTFIVDDDRIFVFGLQKILQINRISNKIEVFSNGKLALDKIHDLIATKSELPELILLDINMPIVDGWEFLSEFIRIAPVASKKIIIYLVTSSIDPADIERAKSYEFVSNYIIKPVKLETLTRALEEDTK